MLRHLPLMLFALLILLRPVCSFARPQQDASIETSVDTIVAAIKLIDERHIDPPTKQEMLKRVITRIRTGKNAGTWSPKIIGVASLVSGLSTDEQFRQVLTDTLEANPDVLASGGDPLQSILLSLGVPIQPNKEAIVQKQIQANRYVGIGIQISVKDGIPRMQRVLPGGPAEKGGAKDLDQIVTVDEKPTKNVPLKTVVDWLRGAKGTAVDVQLKRGDDLIDLELVRNVVPLKTVFVEFKSAAEPTDGPTSDKQVAVVSFRGLGASSVHELRQIETQVTDRGAIGVILDLRLDGVNAPLHETKLLADALIANRSLGFHQTRKSTTEINAGPSQMFDDLRMVVLVNGVVRGPTEWLAAALQSSGAVLVGRSTAGRGTAVESFVIPNSQYTLTIPTGILKTADGRTLYAAANRTQDIPVALVAQRLPNRQSKRKVSLQRNRVHPNTFVDSQKMDIVTSAINHIRLQMGDPRNQNLSEVSD